MNKSRKVIFLVRRGPGPRRHLLRENREEDRPSPSVRFAELLPQRVKQLALDFSLSLQHTSPKSGSTHTAASMATNPQTALTAQPPSFKDFHPGLIIFGIVQLLIAATMFLLAAFLLMVPAAVIARSQSQGGPPFPLAVAATFYIAPGIMFVALGIGSMLKKNWARVGTIAISWLWLAIGIMSMAVTAILMPAIMRSMPSPRPAPVNLSSIITIILVVEGLIAVLLPGIFLLFYHNRNVKATCLQGNPSPGIGARPILMNILIVWFSFGLISILFTLLLKYPVVFFGAIIWPWYGKVIYGLAGTVIALALWGYIKRDIRGWWAAMFNATFWPLSAAVTFLRGGMLDLYRQMGMNGQQLSLLGNEKFINVIFGTMFFFVVLSLGAVVYSRRYFNSNPATAPLLSSV